MTATLTHWINGAAQPGASARFGDVYNPASGEVIARVPFAAPSEVDEAVQAAAEAARFRRRLSRPGRENGPADPARRGRERG